MVLVVIGVGIIMLGVGLFIGRMTAGPHVNKSDNFLSKAIENMKANAAQKKAEKAFAKEIKQQARREAMQGMKDDLVKHYKEDERKKLTGEKRKEKMEKLKKAFSMDNMDAGNKLQSMLGNGGQQSSNANTNFGGGGVTNDQIASMMGARQQPQSKPQGKPQGKTNNKKKSEVKKDLSFDDFLNKL